MELAYIVNNNIGSALQRGVRVGSLAAGTTSGNTVDTNVPTVLEFLEFATDSLDKVRINILDKATNDNVANGIALNGASILTSARPNNLVNVSSWDVVAYNETTNTYKFSFKLRGLIFPKGVTINVENTDTSAAHNAGVYSLSRTL